MHVLMCWWTMRCIADNGRRMDGVGLAAAVLHIERLHDEGGEGDLNASVYHYIALYYTIPYPGIVGIKILAQRCYFSQVVEDDFPTPRPE